MQTRSPIDDVLDVLRVRGAVMANLRARGAWGIDIPATPKATLHAVTSGECWVRVHGRPPLQLRAGDVVLLPTGAAHIVASAPAGPTRAWEKVAAGQVHDPAHECVLDGPGRSGATHVICAGFEYNHDVAQPLLSLMPPVLVLSGQEVAEGSPVQATLRVLGHELAARTPGSAVEPNDGVEARDVPRRGVDAARTPLEQRVDERAADPTVRSRHQGDRILDLQGTLHGEDDDPSTIGAVGEPPNDRAWRLLARSAHGASARERHRSLAPFGAGSIDVGRRALLSDEQGSAGGHEIPPAR